MKSYYKVGSTYRTSHRTSFSVWQSEKLFCTQCCIEISFHVYFIYHKANAALLNDIKQINFTFTVC